MKDMFYQLSGEAVVKKGCTTCDSKSSCEDATTYLSKTYLWGDVDTRRLDFGFEGWEDDKGDRCSFDKGDDCHEKKACTKTVKAGVGSTASCLGTSHGMYVKYWFEVI